LSKGSRGSSERATLMTKLISWFDSYVELYTVDPKRIERSLKGYEGTDLERIWRSIAHDVDQINELAQGSAEVKKSARNAARSRQLSMIIGGVTFVILIAYIFFESQFKALGGQELLLYLPAVMLALLYGLLMVTMLSTRSLNKAMRTFYEKHAGELSKQKGHIREATQQLIDRLSREIYSQNFEPNKFKFQLYHSNYRNVTVVGRNGAKLVSVIKSKGGPSK
jgi:hypothetical protein